MSPQTISYLFYQYFPLQFGEVLQHFHNLKHFSHAIESNDTPTLKMKHMLKYLDDGAQRHPKITSTTLITI